MKENVVKVKGTVSNVGFSGVSATMSLKDAPFGGFRRDPVASSGIQWVSQGIDSGIVGSIAEVGSG